MSAHHSSPALGAVPWSPFGPVRVPCPGWRRFDLNSPWAPCVLRGCGVLQNEWLQSADLGWLAQVGQPRSDSLGRTA